MRYWPSLPASGEVLTPKVMRSTGSSTVEAGQRLGGGGVGEGVADLDLGEAGDDEEVAGDALVDLGPADALEAHELGELALGRAARTGQVSKSSLQMTTWSPLRRVPCTTRPMARRPR